MADNESSAANEESTIDPGFEPATEMPEIAQERTPQIDQAKASALMQRLESEQNLVMGALFGFMAAIGGAIIWACVTVATGYQIGWMAVGLGFLVGYAVRIGGKGLSTIYGIAGAVCALIGCVLGNLFSACGFLAQNDGTSVFNVAIDMALNPLFAVNVLIFTFSPMDLLFYGIAVYEGYRFAFRQVTEEELAGLMTDS